MFPPDLCKELECLHSQAPVHALHFTKSAIAEAVPGSMDGLLEQFDEQPVASGSILHRCIRLVSVIKGRCILGCLQASLWV